MSELVYGEIKTAKKVALVTGSSSGIGANIALDLSTHGYFIVVTGRDQEKLNRVVAKCNEISPDQSDCSAISFKADLLDLKEIDCLIEFISSKLGRLDVLVNNACWRGDHYKEIIRSVADEDLAFDDFRKVMHMNLSVPMYLVQQCLSRLQRTQSQALIVINISSIASHVVVPLHTYSISKACLSEMSRQLARTSRRDILSVAISPGPVLTDERPHHKVMSNMTLMNRVGSTEEISRLVLFAVKNARLLSGQELFIDGGYTAKQRRVSSVGSN